MTPSAQSIKKRDLFRPIGFLVGCMLFALFLSAFSKEGPSRVQSQAKVVDIYEFNGSRGPVKVVKYSIGGRQQVFSPEEHPELKIGSKVQIIYDPKNEFRTFLVEPGDPPYVSPYDTPLCMVQRGLIIIICVTILFLFYEQIRLASKRKDSHDKTTV